MQQNATEIELTEAQEIALAALIAGKTDTDAAKEADVDRTTLYRWRKTVNFRAAYNRARREMREAVQARLLALAAKAIDSVEAAIPNDGKLALQLLRDIGILTNGVASVGEEDPAKLEQNDKLESMFDSAISVK